MSFLAAAALAVLTLATFAVAADRGPESAVKRFHEAIKEGDEAAIDQVLVGSPDGADQARLIGVVRQLLTIDSRVELGRVASIGREATVDVRYPIRGGSFVRFVLDQQQGRWQVDAKKTLDLYRRPFGL